MDLEAQVVLTFTITDGGVGLDGTLLTVLLNDPQLGEGTSTGCTTEAYPVSYLISLSRSDLPDTFRIVHVPRDLTTEEPPAEVQLRT